MFNLRHIQTLRIVAACGSFSAAARALNYTQPAVSRQIALLEEEAGLPLLLRGRRGATLTRAGRVVVDQAEAIEKRLLSLEQTLADLREGPRLAAAIGGFPTAFVGRIPSIIRQLRSHSPQARISLRRCGHDEAISLIESGDLDLALIFAREDTSIDLATIQLTHLGTEPMLVLLPHDHPAASRSSVRLSSLASEPWIIGAPDPSSSIIVSACQEAGFTPQISYETDDPLAIQSLVAAGLGVTLTTPWLRTALRSDVKLVPLTPKPPRRVVQAIIAKPVSPTARLLLTFASSTQLPR